MFDENSGIQNPIFKIMNQQRNNFNNNNLDNKEGIQNPMSDSYNSNILDDTTMINPNLENMNQGQN